MMFSHQLIKKLYPHKETILYNLEVAIQINHSRESMTDLDRVDKLCDCHAALVNNKIEEAAELSKAAGYNAMAEAILFHFPSNARKS